MCCSRDCDRDFVRGSFRDCFCDRDRDDVRGIRDRDCFTIKEGNIFCICVRNPRSWR
jgi:hypothetical protein